MDTNIFTCLEAKGLITESQRAQLSKIAAGLPFNNEDLLTVIAASSIASSQGDAFYGTPMSTESLVSANPTDVQSLTVPDGATRAIVTVFGNNIIFRVDGGVSAANTGHYAATGSNFSIGNLADFKYVAASATNANIFVSYF